MELCSKCADKSCTGYDSRITECEDFTPETKADQIRNMSDEELAEIIKRIRYRDIPIWCDMNRCAQMNDCHECRLAWLRKAAE